MKKTSDDQWGVIYGWPLRVWRKPICKTFRSAAAFHSTSRDSENWIFRHHIKMQFLLKKRQLEVIHKRKMLFLHSNWFWIEGYGKFRLFIYSHLLRSPMWSCRKNIYFLNFFAGSIAGISRNSYQCRNNSSITTQTKTWSWAQRTLWTPTSSSYPIRPIWTCEALWGQT